MLFCTSRSSPVLKMLYTLRPPVKLYLRKCSRRASVKSSVETVGRRPARFRSPTKSWYSFTAENGNPVRHSYSGTKTHPPPTPHVPRTIIRFGTSVGLNEFSFGLMIGFLKFP